MAHPNQQKKTHHRRGDLTGEHTAGDAGQIVLACLFAATWIADTFFFKLTTFPNQDVPLYARIPCGVVWLALSGYLARTGLSIVFGEEREKPGVIRPIYSCLRPWLNLNKWERVFIAASRFAETGNPFAVKAVLIMRL